MKLPFEYSARNFTPSYSSLQTLVLCGSLLSKRQSSRLIGFLKHGKNASRQRERALHRLEEHAVFAEDLGAEVIRTKGHDIARTIVEIVKDRHVTQIVLGQPSRSRWEEILRGSIINRLLRLEGVQKEINQAAARASLLTMILDMAR